MGMYSPAHITSIPFDTFESQGGSSSKIKFFENAFYQYCRTFRFATFVVEKNLSKCDAEKIIINLQVTVIYISNFSQCMAAAAALNSTICTAVFSAYTAVRWRHAPTNKKK